jgi:hypothetical protein
MHVDIITRGGVVVFVVQLARVLRRFDVIVVS